MKLKKHLSPNDYYSYINSNAWRSKHNNNSPFVIRNSQFNYELRTANCELYMFPWVRIGKYSSKKYGKYNIHHTGVGYRHLGEEKLWKDVLPLCPLAHWIIHGGNMKAKAPWQPNLLQKMLHLWCSFPLLIKRLILVLLGCAIASHFSIDLGIITSAILFCLLFF
jgi:hypothetical protein